MKPSLVIAFAALFATACATDVPTLGDEGVELLPADQVSAPVPLTLQADAYALRGGQYILRVSGAPARQNLNLVYSTNAGPPFACPAALAPECLSIGGPITLITTRRTDAQGRVQFTLNVPANPPFNQVYFQIAGKIAGTVYATPAAPVALLNPTADTDNDGIPNNEEGNFGTDPLNADTDGDGLFDGDELTFGTDPLIIDTDADGLDDGDEFILGTNGANPDTDADGLLDGEEQILGTDPTDADTDGDALDDGFELDVSFTNPLDSDSDSDALFDGEEWFTFGTDPNDADTDGDSLTDGEEIILYGTDPLNADTDADGLDDFSELILGTGPLDSDSDDDGLPDGAEFNTYNTDPNNADTDGGGESDGDEIANGRDPLSGADDFGGGGGGTPRLVINEIDYDQASTDANSFIEIFNAGDAAADLTNISVVLFNGTNGAAYATFNLSTAAASLPAGGYLLIANASVVAPGGTPIVTASGDFIQNGAPDGVALLDNGTFTALDALSYEGSMTSVTPAGFPGPISLVEGTAFAGADTNDNLTTLARLPNGADTNNAVVDWALSTNITPGAANF